MPRQPFRPVDRPELSQTTWFSVQGPQTRRTTKFERKAPRNVLARRMVALSMLIAAGTMLAGCAASMFDSPNQTMSESRWDGPMKPRTARTTFVRNGSQPILPPVPTENDGLPPVRMSALVD